MNRYIRLSYDDNTIETISTVYSYFQLGLTQSVQNVVYAHTDAENITGTNG